MSKFLRWNFLLFCDRWRSFISYCGFFGSSTFAFCFGRWATLWGNGSLIDFTLSTGFSCVSSGRFIKGCTGYHGWPVMRTISCRWKWKTAGVVMHSNIVISELVKWQRPIVVYSYIVISQLVKVVIWWRSWFRFQRGWSCEGCTSSDLVIWRYLWRRTVKSWNSWNKVKLQHIMNTSWALNQAKWLNYSIDDPHYEQNTNSKVPKNPLKQLHL